MIITLDKERYPNLDYFESFPARNPPPLCQGICPLSCICVKYYNMTYGDDHKWGGCLEIYGDLIIQILDIKFGCFYLPVKQEQKNTALNKPIHSLLNYMGFSDDNLVSRALVRWALAL